MVFCVEIGINQMFTEQHKKGYGSLPIQQKENNNMFAWFKRKFDSYTNTGSSASGSAFQKVSQAADKIEAAKGKFLALQAVNDNHQSELTSLQRKAAGVHQNLDQFHMDMDNLLDTL